MGPSFADVPNEFLESYVTFGVNKIWLKEFSPTYYVVVDNWMNQYTRQMKEMRCTEYFVSEGNAFTRDIGGATRLAVALRDTPEGQWEMVGGTVIFFCLQVAHIMGFTTVLFVGLDHTGDGTHFHPRYDDWGAKRTYQWNAAGVDATFENVNEKYKESGRRIINLTPGSKCDVFEKQDIKLWQTHT